ncbi:MAG: hypothetical protein LBL28_05130 [Treponema sp.]|jgi:hypothetical protein|nr:hypothetical protein [Treponema sp.]
MKAVKIIFIFFFLACLAIPLTFIDTKTIISALERRVLAQPPKIFVNGRLDKKRLETLPSQIDAYIIDRFAFRSQVVSFMNNVNFFVLHKSHDKKLLVGKDKWLFYIDKSLGDEFANFKKTNLFTEEELQKFLDKLMLINSYCEKNNIQFIFLLVPTTSSVYPEKYPFPRPGGFSRADQLLNAMPETLREKAIFPLDYFLSKKDRYTQPMYYNNGLHWNKLGAYYASELLYQKLKNNFPNLPEITFKFTPYIDPGEDNYALLWWGIKKFGNFMELLNIEPQSGWANHYTYIVCDSVQENSLNTVVGYPSRKGKYGIVTANKDPSLPTAIVMRDSYFTDLEPFTSLFFSLAEYIWTQPEKRSLDYLYDLPKKPDVFIWEIAERGLEAVPPADLNLFPFD